MDPTTLTPELRRACVNTLRFLSIDAVEKAKSGHPGLPMGAAEMAFVLWSEFLRFNPRDPAWVGRDRFILSAGHGSMLQYALLHLSGYDVSLEELKNFRQWGSKTPGHPEFGHTPGVEVTTGPLGQGFAHGVGMALAARHLSARFETAEFNPFDCRIWGIVSDGDLMEGVSAEAASLAGHLGLGNLVYLYDSNRITIDGSTDLTFTEDVGRRFEAYGWDVQYVDGHDARQVASALAAARDETERPSLIVANTTIGFGSPGKAGTSKCHGAPLGPDEAKKTRAALGWTEETFHVPDEVRAVFAARVEENRAEYERWNERLRTWRAAHPDRAADWDALFSGALPANLEAQLVAATGSAAAATRALAGKALSRAAELVPGILGGSADLDESTVTKLAPFPVIQRGAWGGRNIHFGIREHAMAAAVNGLTLFGGLRAYCSTFLQFADYMRPAVRLAALMKTPSIFVFTHDSVFLGEDGPTHQPVEHVPALRAIPNLEVWRPADARECGLAWAAALRRTSGPTALVLSRQKIALAGGAGATVPANADEAAAYVVHEPAGAPEAVVVATGSEVPLAVDAAKMLGAEGRHLRVVSLPCLERFLARDAAAQEALLPRRLPVAVVEAARTDGWYRLAGRDGLVIGLDDFGASAPYEVLAEKLGFTPPQVAAKLRAWLGARA